MASESKDKAVQASVSATVQPISSAPAPNRPLTEAEQERMHRLGLELRCLVCQNQSIADSHSGLAIDLRKQIAGQIQEGKSDDAIKQYMVERYGDFVLYKPAFSLNNAALWSGPFILLLLGVILAIRSIKRRKLNENAPASNASAGTASIDARLQEIEARYQRESGR